MKKHFDAQGSALPHIQQLHPYIPGEQPKGGGWVKLNTNENPHPPSPNVAVAIQSQLDQLQLYPE
ncbi:MAG: histidinol phosphate aminotransferase, partial [Puniceicoccaceae bacterium]|nr:histidinol phosphate aminotransferase [Puniceicoccaceae bacterium]